MTLDDELDQILAARDRDNMQPTIDALTAIATRHPHDARVLYEVGGAYDTAGEEGTACHFYERALEAGLSGDVLRRCFLQYGSTLRNLGELDRSIQVFEEARRAFPDSLALKVFEAISFQASGRFNEAIASLLDVISDEVSSVDIDRYRPAIRGNADDIRSQKES